MKQQHVKKALLASLAAACAIPFGQAQAGATIPIGPDKSLSVGFGMRGSYASVEDGAADGSRSSDFNLDSARLFFGASLNKNIKGMFNTEWDGGQIRVLDAVGMFEVSPEFNVWAGRLLAPSDRANMAGPYYSLGGGYWAGVASRYGYNGGIFRGRDDGVTVWGNVMGGKVGYSVGVFEGHTFGIGSLTQGQARTAGVKSSDDLMVAGRVQLDFWDAEPGYYGTGNYLGAKDILAVGFAARQQKNGVLTVAGKGDYASWNVDFLMEKKLGAAGALSVESAYYDYDTDNVILSEQGKAWSAGAAYITAEPMGWGRLQPFVRFQKFSPDAGVNYVIDGYNAQISAVYTSTRVTAMPKRSAFVVALQLQY
jgi:hypothetical protein